MQLSVRVHNVVETGLASLGIWCVMLTKQKNVYYHQNTSMRLTVFSKFAMWNQENKLNYSVKRVIKGIVTLKCSHFCRFSAENDCMFAVI